MAAGGVEIFESSLIVTPQEPKPNTQVDERARYQKSRGVRGGGGVLFEKFQQSGALLSLFSHMPMYVNFFLVKRTKILTFKRSQLTDM